MGSTKETQTHLLTEMPCGGQNWGPWSPTPSPNSPPLHTFKHIILRTSKIFLQVFFTLLTFLHCILHNQLFFPFQAHPPRYEAFILLLHFIEQKAKGISGPLSGLSVDLVSPQLLGRSEQRPEPRTRTPC